MENGMAPRWLARSVVVVALVAAVPSTWAASGRIGFNGGCAGDFCEFDPVGVIDGAEVRLGVTSPAIRACKKEDGRSWPA
jgi:hypothetical protein